MKAATLSKRPGFSLMRQSDVQSFYHLQMPRWLFYDKRYMPLSLEAKVVYTFLLNRFQLSTCISNNSSENTAPSKSPWLN